MSDNSHKKDAVDTVKDMIKLLTTLSTGTVIFSGVYLGSVKMEAFSMIQYMILLLSWLCLGLSIFCGIFLAYGRVIAMIDKNEYNVNDHHLKQFLQAQELFFIVGIILFGIFISLMSLIVLIV